MAVKPTIPSGTRDFSPEEVYKRQFIFNTIRSVFEKYGYQPIETPTMENLSTLEGKYGEEGDRLLFRILNSGNIFESIQNPKSEIRNSAEAIKALSEKGLRYDLTVPFARYVVMHQNEITFPFKRYQIQPVFRADRPQRGRYREFFQCDADVVGSDSLIYEVELIQIYDEVFKKLGIDVKIRINNRKILSGIAEKIGAKDRMIDLSIAMDKYDKGGMDKVKDEMRERNFSEDQIASFETLVSEFMKGSSGQEKIALLQKHLSSTSDGVTGAKEIDWVMKHLSDLYSINKPDLDIDISLARGLNYYTGAIIEVNSKVGSLKSSLGGGGRYDDLTGMFGLKGVSGVGISFGADRIYDVMEELKLFPTSAAKGTQVLFCYFDEASMNYCLPLVKQIRDEGIAAEIYPSVEKMKKQLKYANDKKIPFVVMVGENEMKSEEKKLGFKDMVSGDQTEATIEEIIQRLK